VDRAAARKDLEQALELRIKHGDPASPWRVQLQGMLAEYFLAAGDPGMARAALAQTHASKALTALPYFAQPLDRLRGQLTR
jgi:hypothetical protein